MNRGGSSDKRQAVNLLSSGLFVMTAVYDHKRSGVLVSSAQKCGDEPLLIGVACRKGHPIEPLIRDSHRFALSQLDAHDRNLARRFEEPPLPDDRYDPFDLLEVDHLISHAPILKRSALAFDCEVYRHFDIESDHELYIGLVIAARIGAHTGGSDSAGERGAAPRADD